MSPALPTPPAPPPAPTSYPAARGRNRTSALIAGGGIAGIAAALRLAEAGLAVTLLETRKKLGGRATSFVDPRSGETLDNCQHVTMGCCTSYLDLLGRLGALDQIQWHREQFWIERGGRTSVVRPSVLPAPAHFAPAILGAKFLSTGEKAALAWGGHCVAHADRARWRDRSFGQFLAHARQPARLIERFWAPVVVSACNLACDRVCAASALHVFQDGFFGSPRAAEIGISRVPLLQLYDRAEEAIRAAGGQVRLGCGVERLDASSITTTSGERLSVEDGGAVICALTPERAAEVIDSNLFDRDPRFPLLRRVSFSPILGVHLAFDRPVMNTPHAVLVEAQTQWLFRKDDEGRKLHAVISAADALMDLSEQQIADRVLADIRAYFPAATGASLVSARSVKEKRATFAATPEFERLRPGATGPSGVILAGDYTATGWPATMEGAARSGYAAAAAVLGSGSLIAPELPRTGLARWLVRSGA